MELTNVQPKPIAPAEPRDLSTPSKIVDTTIKQAPPAVVHAPAVTTVSEKDLDAAIKKINRFIDSSQSSIAFRVDNATGISVVQVIDTVNDKIIRQFPSEETLSIARDLEQGITKSFLLNTKV